MFTYNTLTSLYPDLRQHEPAKLADEVYRTMYAGEYENREEFVSRFTQNKAPLTAQDMRKIDPSFGRYDDDKLFDATMSAVGFDPNEEGMDTARALFRGEADEREWSEVLPDLAKSFRSSSARMGAGLAWLAGLLPGEKGAMGQALTSYLDEKSDEIGATKSDPLQQKQALVQERQAGRVLEGDNVASRFGQAALDYVADPALAADVGVGSLPYMVPVAGAARAGAAIRGVKGAMVGQAFGAGILEGTDAAVETRGQILEMPQEELEQLEVYQELIADGVSETVARGLAAEMQAKKAFAVTAPIATAAGGLTARFESGLLNNISVRDGVVKTLGKEIAEESIQEGANQLGQNVGLEQPLGEGVAEASGMGAAMGITQTGAFKGVEYASDGLSGKLPAKREARSIIEKARDGEALSEAQITLAKEVYPELVERDDVFNRSRESRLFDELSDPEAKLASGEVDLDTEFSQLDIFTGEVASTGERQDDLFGDDPTTIQLLDDVDTPAPNAGQGDLFDPQAQLFDGEGPGEVSYRRGGIAQPDLAAVNQLEEATRPVGTGEVLPSAPEGLTNAEVYDVLARDADAGGDLNLAERQFISDYRDGRVLQDTEFQGAEGEVVPRGMESGLTRASISAVAPMAQAPIDLTPAEPTTSSGLVTEQGEPIAPVEATVREFRTKKEAELAARQRLPDYEVFQAETGAWRYRPATPIEVTPPVEPSPTEQIDLEDVPAPPRPVAPPPQAELPGMETEPASLGAPRGPAIEESLAPEVEANVAAQQDRGRALAQHFKGNVGKWWSSLSAGKRMKVLQDTALGDDIAALPAAERRALLATRDINQLPPNVLDPEKLALEIGRNGAFRESVGIPSDQELEQYGGYARTEIKPLKVEVPVTIESTGETKMVKQNALKALDETDAQIGKYDALLKCLGG